MGVSESENRVYHGLPRKLHFNEQILINPGGVGYFLYFRTKPMNH